MRNNRLSYIKEVVSDNYFGVLVFAVVLIAFILRYFHTKTGLPYLYYWDEPQTVSVALQIMKTGDFNPHFFHYGSMMIYSNLFVDILHYLSLMGSPSTSESYLTSINEIKTMADTGWFWTISHPGFYHWNRVVTALLGTGTVFVTFLIGKHLFNKWTGLIAALFLAILSYHIKQSAWITTDVPVGFFVLTVVLFSTLFIRDKKLLYFILSLIAAGMAVATKYNAAVSIAIPLVALVWVYVQSRESVKVYMWLLVPTVPIIVFLSIMPYAVIDLPTFLDHVGYEVYHYKIEGHGDSTSIPGWDHFSYQIQHFYNNIGLLNAVVIAIGVAGIFFRPLFMFTLLLPIIYIWYMTGMKVNFHRNYTQVYPFIALLFASGAYYLFYLFAVMRRRFALKSESMGIILPVIFLTVFFVPQLFASFELGILKYNSRDTRTVVIDELNQLKDIEHVVIAEELRVHEQDLRKLSLPYSIAPLLSMASNPSDKNAVYLLPENLTSFAVDADLEKLEKMKRFISSIDGSSIMKIIGNSGATSIDILSVNPGIMLVTNLPVAANEDNANPGRNGNQ